MNDAYKIESQCAIQPRIVISDELFDLIRNNTEPAVTRAAYKELRSISKLNEDLKPINNIFRDDDGFYFLNPFPLSNEMIAYQKLAIENEIDRNSGNKKIRSKYLWLASKFNQYLTNNEKKWCHQNMTLNSVCTQICFFIF